MPYFAGRSEPRRRSLAQHRPKQSKDIIYFTVLELARFGGKEQNRTCSVANCVPSVSPFVSATVALAFVGLGESASQEERESVGRS